MGRASGCQGQAALGLLMSIHAGLRTSWAQSKPASSACSGLGLQVHCTMPG